MEVLSRLLAACGPKAFWIIILFGGLAVIYMLYIGVAMRETFRAHDHEQRQISYQVFHDLLELFPRRRHR